MWSCLSSWSTVGLCFLVIMLPQPQSRLHFLQQSSLQPRLPYCLYCVISLTLNGRCSMLKCPGWVFFTFCIWVLLNLTHLLQLMDVYLLTLCILFTVHLPLELSCPLFALWFLLLLYSLLWAAPSSFCSILGHLCGLLPLQSLHCSLLVFLSFLLELFYLVFFLLYSMCASPIIPFFFQWTCYTIYKLLVSQQPVGDLKACTHPVAWHVTPLTCHSTALTGHLLTYLHTLLSLTNIFHVYSLKIWKWLSSFLQARATHFAAFLFQIGQSRSGHCVIIFP